MNHSLNRPGLRLAGLVGLVACLIAYDPTSSTVIHQLLVPLLMAAASWALIQNLSAVLLGVTVLAFIHTDLAAAGWIDRLAYPTLAATAALSLSWIVSVRFRARINATHDARWNERRS